MSRMGKRPVAIPAGGSITVAIAYTYPTANLEVFAAAAPSTPILLPGDQARMLCRAEQSGPGQSPRA